MLNLRFQIILSGAIIFFVTLMMSGCGGPTKASLVKPTPTPSKMNADNVIEIRELRFTGGLEARYFKLFEPFLGGFAEVGDEIKCVHETEFNEGILDVLIDTSFSATGMTKAKYVPIVGGMMYAYGSGELAYDWEGTVQYTLFDNQGQKIIADAFRLTGRDTMEAKGGMTGMTSSVLTGGGVMAAFYPDEEAQKQVGDEFLKLAGQEIAKRLRSGKAASYFVDLTKARDGMDPRTYALFVTKKKRIQEERSQRTQQMQQNRTAMVEDESHNFMLENGTVMVFGVGVNDYEHFPDLQYAAGDCKKFVDHFKNRYQLSDDLAVCLTNEEATAIKVLRFIERNATRLLTEDDTFIFYFSGHGAPDPDPDSTDDDGLRKYLLLPDSEPDALSLTAISLNDLAALVSRLPCRRVLVFIDSCFAGEAGKDTLSSLKGMRISEKSFKNTAAIAGKGRVIIAASGENQVSQETDTLRAGVFTHFLMEGLKASADRDGDNRVDILELYRFVRSNVEHMTRGAQVPVFRGTLDRNIIF